MALGNILRGRKEFSECADVYRQGRRDAGGAAAPNWMLFYFRGICHERSKQWANAGSDLKRRSSCSSISRMC